MVGDAADPGIFPIQVDQEAEGGPRLVKLPHQGCVFRLLYLLDESALQGEFFQDGINLTPIEGHLGLSLRGGVLSVQESPFLKDLPEEFSLSFPVEIEGDFPGETASLEEVLDGLKNNGGGGVSREAVYPGRYGGESDGGESVFPG